MKIGIFDSGLGGLVITKAFINALPEYDYIYYGDTANLPYGDKTSGQILAYTLEAMKFLISKKCALIIIACNTATAVALYSAAFYSGICAGCQSSRRGYSHG